MNKQELIEIIAEKSHTTKSDSKKMLEAFIETVTETNELNTFALC